MDCQVVHICDCFPARIRRALAELPETLDETYERTLRGINKANWEFAHRMFQFVSVASRPLHTEELADLLAFDFEVGSIPEFYKDWRVEYPGVAVMSTCSTLLAIVNRGPRTIPVIQFSHFSVKEFLTSTRLTKATEILSRYHVSMTHAHTLVTQACLGILLHLDKDVTSDSLKDLPLAEYAARHWVDHARFEGVSQNVEDGMKQLFDPSKPHLAICVWICDPADSTRERTTRNKTPPPLLQTSLHYAASWGLHLAVKFLLIEHLQDVNSRDTTDNATPLHLASRNGHLKSACVLIEHGADLTAQNRDGQTPLHLALQMGQVIVARMLIEHGADLTAQNSDWQTPLHLVLQLGQADDGRIHRIHHVHRVRRIRSMDPTRRVSGGWASLVPMPPLLPWSSEQVDITRMLIERGSDLTAQDMGGQTPLHHALKMGRVDVDCIIFMLIEHGADLTAKNRDGQTPLHLASRMGRVNIARILIDRGADLTARNRDGQTPLHLALRMGRADVARMLIERGADLTARNNDRQTPLHLALKIKIGQENVAPMFIERRTGLTPLSQASYREQVDVVRMLIERGEDLSAQNWVGQTPLHLALQMGQVDVARMLIEHGASLTTQQMDRQTPLHLALKMGQADVARMLIERGTDLTAKNNCGLTPLHLALETGQVDVARMLIEHGASPTDQQMDGQPPLHLALQDGNVAQILVERGADLTAENGDG